MKYLFYISSNLATKNRLQSAIVELVAQYNRTLVLEANLTAFKAELISEVIKLNNKFPKCKPEEISFWQHTNSIPTKTIEYDWQIDKPYFISGFLLACKERGEQW